MAELTDEDDALLAALGVDVEAKKASSRTPREERIIAGFEDVQRFFEEHKRKPLHGEDRDIFERLYAVRLDRMLDMKEYRDLLEPLDSEGLLEPSGREPDLDEMDDDALLAALGVEVGTTTGVAKLEHVRSSADKRAAEDIANRERCEDFETFKPLFTSVQAELNVGTRTTRPFGRDTEILPGQFFILGGQKAYVHELGTEFETPEGRTNRRMRVIFDNGTESKTLLRSFQRALYKEENHGRRITEPAAGPLFSGKASEGDQESGVIYVLRSKSDHPMVASNRDLVHKIGVTGGAPEKRIANARNDATYLLADVEIVATYRLFNINRAKLEKLLHRFFAEARFDIEIEDRFGKTVRPREWYLIPLSAIDDTVSAIQSGVIENFTYSKELAKLVSVSE